MKTEKEIKKMLAAGRRIRAGKNWEINSEQKRIWDEKIEVLKWVLKD